MKAVLVMDMPESCMGCNLFHVDMEYERETCEAKREARLVDLDAYEKPDWCPLIPLPEKDTGDYTGSEWRDGYKHGWNDCIDAISRKMGTD